MTTFNRHSLKLLGKGQFTRCFAVDDQTVILDTCCPCKEIYALGWMPESKLFPVLESVEMFGAKHNAFKTERLEPFKLSEVSELHQKYYRELRRVFAESRPTMNIYDSYSATYKAFESIKYRALRENMIEALDAMSNIGPTVSFEISPRNVKRKGKQMVLIDCFFDRRELIKRTAY